MTIEDLIRQARERLSAKLTERQAAQDALLALRSAVGTDDSITEEQVREAIAKRDALDTALDELRAKVSELEAEKARDEEVDRLSREVVPAATRPSYDNVARVGAEARTYSPDIDRRGQLFIRDVMRNYMFGDVDSRERLARHMAEERVERGQYQARDVGTAAFAGLTVPQYLVDLVAPAAKAGRPLANAMRVLDLPEIGTSVNISKITTGTAAALQANEHDATQETNIDDTLLQVSVQTNAGHNTISRQAAERSVGALDITVEDLVRSYHTNLDATLLNQATTGLTNVATAITYTDGSPTAAEFYPKTLAAAAAVEGALLDMDTNDAFLVMHSRRWYWLSSQLSTSWPLVAQPSVAVQTAGTDFGVAYGSGFRGILPSGMAVVVDNNIATNLGGGTNEDEVYCVAKSESFLWEDPNAPMFIRAEQAKATNLGIDLVVYGYFAYTFTRRAHAQKVSGTGLVTPTF